MHNKQLLIALYQNTSTSLQSIDELIKKTEDKTFNSLLKAQYDRYDKMQAKIEKVAQAKDVNLKDNNWFEKAKLWSSIQMSTLTDNSTRHLAELMLMGTVMGTLTLYKNRIDFGRAEQDVIALLDQLEQLEEDHFNELKKYLKG
ncbi:MAG: hypothetical protein E7378_03220 [Clostridiales bacterium]|nr:hypothetical protein [Clostridiales bacterium]